MTAIAVTIAGSDSGGGAGIQADLKTFSALGVYGASVITALTAQNTRGVQGIYNIPPDFVKQQIDSVFSDLDVNAVKIGMLSQPDIIQAVANGLGKYNQAQIILDPVMVAASGDRLIAEEAVTTLKESLLPLALLITPNLPEAAVILGDNHPASNEQEVISQAERLLKLGPKAVLIKGGHGNGPESTDILLDHNGVYRLSSARLNSHNTHGTGCTLSSAITAFIAKGADLREAITEAKRYLTAALKAADSLHIGHGIGPVHHFHKLWK
ncbi:bifunctional hydroxymethylpyrimidine kinase/phosphomethylpyrimidine kinase [Microvirga sp. W0021]|uniref:hydroxymethylpyrimidine kinase n=1 Tax=Hohaiivirga grylli TaxID=3133970 RepID=A0ABV0BML5_9HYPH